LLWWGLLLALTLFAFQARAHESFEPLAADSVAVSADGFSLVVSGQEAILVGQLHEPDETTTGIIVIGDDGSEASTGFITLDPTAWSEDTSAEEWIYTDASGSRGGITSVVISNGGLEISGSGTDWPWDSTGSYDEVWVHFRIENEWFCAKFSEANATVETNSAGEFSATAASAPGSCLSEICGNGIVDEDSDEECDDGNREDADSCTNACETNSCSGSGSADSTFEAIQSVIFDNYCVGCHNAEFPGGAAGDLDLSPGVSYAALYGQPSSAVPAMDLVVAGERRDSFLYEKIAAKTLGGETTLASMPSGLLTVSEAHLEALGLWISAGAPESLSVEGTADLLETCLPLADPLKIDPVPSAPPPELGVQLQQTAWPLHAESEDELCMATYYDFSEIIPEEHQLDCTGGSFGDNVNNPTGKCFYYDETLLIQDAQSHHSIIKIYLGDTPVDFSDGDQCVNVGAPEVSCNGDDSLCDSSLGAGDGDCSDPNEEFGPWTLKPNYPDEPGAESGPCDPKDIDSFLGYNPDCSGAIVSGVACTGYGPPDSFNAPNFAGSQEAYSHAKLAEGVYRIQPVAGVVIWNSHAFNLTTKDSTLAQYLNLFYGEEGKRDYYGRGIFDASKIFVQQVPPFETVEYCQTYTVPENSRVFSLSSHTHLRGVRFRIWEPSNPVCELTGVQALPCADTDGDRLADCPCEPGDPDQLIYYSTSYTDPIALEIDPPLAVGSTVEERTFLYCSLFDNGSTEDSPPVKRQSTSPSSPPFALGDLQLGQEFEFGGPCPDEDTPIFLGAGDTTGVLGWRHGVRCMDNTDKKGLPCSGDDAFCDSSEDEGDGVCDACFSMGGFTTEDEMYILLGSYYIPEPAAGLLWLSALVTLAGLRRGRRVGRGQPWH
jgi:hypothetical protein